jgi:hypothetical protein
VSSNSYLYLLANENQVLGDVCFVNSSGEMQIAKSDVIANTNSDLFMAVTNNTANTTGKYMAQGTVRNNSWNWKVGGNVFLSTIGTTGNCITQTAPASTGNVIQNMGVAISSNTLWFNGNTITIEHN